MHKVVLHETTKQTKGVKLSLVIVILEGEPSI